MKAGNVFHFERMRLNQLFKEAVRYPVVMICAGAGYGKTSAVHDFVRGYAATTAWMQLSERDNVGGRFWENFIHTIGQVNTAFCKAIASLGLPDTEDKFNKYLAAVQKYLPPLEKWVLVLDDVHILEDPLVIRFTERILQNLSVGTSVILISRSTPRLNITSMVSKGHVFTISESELCFSENEAAQYFGQLEISPQTENLREIMQDTEGWVFALNLIARSYQKAPGYTGYLRSAMKSNIFQLMETEIWDGISAEVQSFLVRLSLISHLSFELIDLLAKGDKDLVAEMERQNAYVRRDSYINAYLIHHLFLEFLVTKQHLLSEEQKRETYAIAGEWCNQNGFKIDALSYYEKIGDYTTIIAILYAMPAQMPFDVAQFCLAIFDRAPQEAYDTVLYLALTHVRCCMRTGQWQRSIELAQHYETKLLQLPQDSQFRVASLAGLYLLWSYLRNFLCVNDDVFDFDIYLEKFCQCHGMPEALKNHSTRVRVLGPWAIANGSSKKGMPEKYIQAVSRASVYMPKTYNGFMGGEEELVKGELLFFQGDMNASETLFAQAIIKAKEHRQFEIHNRAMLYTIRLCIAQGNYPKIEQMMKDMKAQMDEADYANRFVNYDIALGVYSYAVGLMDKVPESIKRDISAYSHASFIENLENQLKIRFKYFTRNYPPILAYIQEMRQRESYLFGRLAMMAMESCIYYKMKDKEKAFAVLAEAHETASPNDLVMHFIELGKDMRTVTNFALKEAGNYKKIGSIPKPWLEMINRKSASYAKRHAHIITQYRDANNMVDTSAISPRETDILTDLSHGLSRAEIASSRNISINTVKMVINNLYSKLGAENLADLIRIAVERKLI